MEHVLNGTRSSPINIASHADVLKGSSRVRGAGTPHERS